MSTAGGASEGELRQQIAKLTGQLKQQKTDFEKQISTLEQSAAAMASGRDRLRQMQELQDARQREKEEFESRIAELEEQVESLNAEVEELAEINKQLTEALQHNEGEDTGDSGQRAIASFEAKGMDKRVEQLEQMTQRQLEVISAQEETIDEMAKELVTKGNEVDDLQEELVSARRELKEVEQKIPTLEAALKKAQSEHGAMKQNRTKDTAVQEEMLEELQVKFIKNTRMYLMKILNNQNRSVSIQ